jgi:hypothetical protein
MSLVLRDACWFKVRILYISPMKFHLVLRMNSYFFLDVHFFPTAQQPLVDKCLLIIEVSRFHSDTPHSDPSGRVISLTQRPLPDNTQQSQETDIHATGGNPTHDPNKRAAADPQIRPRRQWYRVWMCVGLIKFVSVSFCLL